MVVTEKEPESVATADNRRISALNAALAGVVAAGAALGAGELVASMAAPRPGPVIGVANRVIDYAPSWFVDFGKAVFGLADKPALIIGTVLISLTLGAVFGLVARRSMMVAAGGFVAFGVIGFLSVGSDAQSGWIAGFVFAAVAAGVGVIVLRMLFDVAGQANETRRGLRADQPSPTDPPVSRRRFLGAAALVGAAGAVAAASARELRARSSASQARDAIEFTDGPQEVIAEIDAIVERAATGPVGSTPNISPLVITEDFYKIDTALVTPQVDPANWSLTIKGMVDREMTYTYDELLDRAQTVAPVTLSCVSNEVGGTLVGNAVWRGVPLTELLDEAGVQSNATQIASRSVDGWDCGFPTAAAYDGRTALVAVGMNDEPLPIRHGFPARLVIAGLYGYVSATKWLKEIELTTVEDFNGYWIRDNRGWAKLGPVKTQSRIDTPRNRSEVAAGSTVAIAGVAWAPDRGIERVEVRVGQGEWMEAELGESLGPDSWIQWKVAWDATPGDHIVQVRATDGTGTTQPAQATPPKPDGADGWHRVEITAV